MWDTQPGDACTGRQGNRLGIGAESTDPSLLSNQGMAYRKSLHQPLHVPSMFTGRAGPGRARDIKEPRRVNGTSKHKVKVGLHICHILR